jgi:chorismate mutase
MDLNELRLEIDKIDDQLVQLFVQRMNVSAQIADYKKLHNLPIFVPTREAEKLRDVAHKAGPDMDVYTSALYSMLFELSRGYQSKRNASRTALFDRISDAISNTPKLMPKDVTVAIMFDQEENVQLLCQKVFGQHSVIPFKNTEGIFSAVHQGMCRYGILPADQHIKELYDQISALGLFVTRRFLLQNHSQYICVSKTLEIYPGADRTCIRMALLDQPGALYKLLARLYTLNINVVDVVSRPITEQPFQRMFYFELQTSVYSQEFVQLICELDDLCKEFSYLGSYIEVV